MTTCLNLVPFHMAASSITLSDMSIILKTYYNIVDTERDMKSMSVIFPYKTTSKVPS